MENKSVKILFCILTVLNLILLFFLSWSPYLLFILSLLIAVTIITFVGNKLKTLLYITVSLFVGITLYNILYFFLTNFLGRDFIFSWVEMNIYSPFITLVVEYITIIAFILSIVFLILNIKERILYLWQLLLLCIIFTLDYIVSEYYDSSFFYKVFDIFLFLLAIISIFVTRSTKAKGRKEGGINEK